MGFSLMGVSNHPKGTVVVLKKAKDTRCTYVRGGEKRIATMRTVYKAFFDKNNNGKLDKKDMMFDSKFFCESCPAGSRSVGAAEGVGFCVRSVTAKDIKKFGKVVSAKFRAAKKRRKLITPMIKRMIAKRQEYAKKTIFGKKRELSVDKIGAAGVGLFLAEEAFGLKDNPKIPNAIIQTLKGYQLYSFFDMK